MNRPTAARCPGGFVLGEEMGIGSTPLHPRILALVATAFGRMDLLLERAIPSIYTQQGVDPRYVQVLIVDDNPAAGGGGGGMLSELRDGVLRLRSKFGLDEDAFPTCVIANGRTHGHSGSGAWNTGIFWWSEKPDANESFVAILDDDDEWMPDYLTSCLAVVGPNVIGVAAWLIWVREEKEEPRKLAVEDLTQEAFFVGNPGIQGSNTFIATRLLLSVGGFDEAYESTCDRELMIRILDVMHPEERYVVVPHVLVRHHDHRQSKVNTDRGRKQRSLDRFYWCHGHRFSESSLVRSLVRAKAFFGYIPYMERSI